MGFVDKSLRAVKYSDGTVSRADGTILSFGRAVRDKNFAFLPFREGFCAYSAAGGKVSGVVGAEKAEVYEITPQGDKTAGGIKCTGGIACIDAKPGAAYYIKPLK